MREWLMALLIALLLLAGALGFWFLMAYTISHGNLVPFFIVYGTAIVAGFILLVYAIKGTLEK